MQAIRTIIDSEQLAPIIPLPLNMRNQEVEVIVIAPGDSPVENDSNEQRERIEQSLSWFTPKEKEQFRRNRERLAEKFEKRPRMPRKAFLAHLLECPVADEETIRRQEEFKEYMREWKMK